MIGADGGRTDKSDRSAFQQRAIDGRHRPHQQHVRVGEIAATDCPARPCCHRAKAAEQGLDPGHVFIRDDFQLQSTRSGPASSLAN